MENQQISSYNYQIFSYLIENFIKNEFYPKNYSDLIAYKTYIWNYVNEDIREQLSEYKGLANALLLIMVEFNNIVKEHRDKIVKQVENRQIDMY